MLITETYTSPIYSEEKDFEKKFYPPLIEIFILSEKESISKNFASQFYSEEKDFEKNFFILLWSKSLFLSEKGGDIEKSFL